MTGRIALMALVALPLAGCDAAGDTFDATLRQGFVQQCQQVSQAAGIAAGAVSQVCECSADKWLERPVAERAQIDRAIIEETIRACAGSAGQSPASSTTGANNG